MSKVIDLVKTVLLAGAFVLAILAVWSKLAAFAGYQLTLVGRYEPSRLLELAAFALLFVIALQLREIGAALGAKS